MSLGWWVVKGHIPAETGIAQPSLPCIQLDIKPFSLCVLDASLKAVLPECVKFFSEEVIYVEIYWQISKDFLKELKFLC